MVTIYSCSKSIWVLNKFLKGYMTIHWILRSLQRIWWWYAHWITCTYCIKSQVVMKRKQTNLLERVIIYCRAHYRSIKPLSAMIELWQSVFWCALQNNSRTPTENPGESKLLVRKLREIIYYCQGKQSNIISYAKTRWLQEQMVIKHCIQRKFALFFNRRLPAAPCLFCVTRFDTPSPYLTGDQPTVHTDTAEWPCPELRLKHMVQPSIMHG